MATILLSHKSNRTRRTQAIGWLEKAKDATSTLDPAIVSALTQAYRKSGRSSDAMDLEKALQSQREAEEEEASLAP